METSAENLIFDPTHEGVRQEISGSLTALILAFVENQSGRQGVEHLVQRTGKSEAFLRDPNNWVGHPTFLRMLECSVDLLKDEDCPRQMGRHFGRFAPGIVKWLMASERSPAAVFGKMETFMASLSRTALVSVEEAKSNHARLVYRPVAFVERNRLESGVFKGILESVPTLFGLPYAKVNQQVKGDHENTYTVRWKNKSPFLMIAPPLCGLLFFGGGMGLAHFLELSHEGLCLAGGGSLLSGILCGILIHVYRVHRRAVGLVVDEAQQLLEGHRLVHRKISELAKAKDDLEMAYMSTIKALVKALEAKDSFTRGHSMRVARYAVELGKKMGLTRAEMRDLSFACFVHDIGKIGVDDEILRKKAMLDVAELKHVRAHCEIGQDIVSTVTTMGRIASLVRLHHERWDGSGYPDGLKGEEIPLLTRILSVADVFDVLIAGRHYKAPLSIEQARAELAKEAGKQFDPELVRAFLEVIDDEAIESAPTGIGRRGAVLRFSKRVQSQRGQRYPSSAAGGE